MASPSARNDALLPGHFRIGLRMADSHFTWKLSLSRLIGALTHSLQPPFFSRRQTRYPGHPHLLFQERGSHVIAHRNGRIGTPKSAPTPGRQDPTAPCHAVCARRPPRAGAHFGGDHRPEVVSH
jgi:hypothetical protein